MISSIFSTFTSLQVPSIRFQGYRTTVITQNMPILPEEYLQKRRKLVDDALLARLIRHDRDSHNQYYEDLPQSLLDAFQHNLPQLRNTMDALKKDLANVPLRQGVTPRKYVYGSKPVTVAYANQGGDGIVYKVTVDGQAYALKVFKSGIASTQPYEEMVNGAYLSAHKTRDVARLYMARPSANWLLMEFIDKNTTLAGRTGKTMAQQGVETEDDCYRPNRINGILVDYGGELTVPGGFLDQDTFERKVAWFDQQVLSGNPTLHHQLCPCYREQPMSRWHLLQQSPYKPRPSNVNTGF